MSASGNVTPPQDLEATAKHGTTGAGEHLLLWAALLYLFGPRVILFETLPISLTPDDLAVDRLTDHVQSDLALLEKRIDLRRRAFGQR